MGIFAFIRRAIIKDRLQDSRPVSLGAIVSESERPTGCDTGNFVASALRAAQATHFTHRDVILTDIAGVLDCDASDLDFLFHKPIIAANDIVPVIMPDYRAVLHAELSAVAH